MRGGRWEETWSSARESAEREEGRQLKTWRPSDPEIDLFVGLSVEDEAFLDPHILQILPCIDLIGIKADAHPAVGAEVSWHRHEFMLDILLLERLLCPEDVLIKEIFADTLELVSKGHQK